MSLGRTVGGTLDPVKITGTIANAVLPTASAARGLTGFRMIDCGFRALAQMLPDRVVAAGEGGNTGVSTLRRSKQEWFEWTPD